MPARWAKELLPEHVNYVGGHPMAGKETQGIKFAEATLFKEKAWVVVPAPAASEGAVKSVLGLINISGAEPLFVDAEEHDQYAAAISHLPLVMSAALFNLVRTSPSWDDIAPLAASGFRDLTRLASGDPRMSHDICATNGDAIAHWIDRFIVELQRFKDLMQENQKSLFKNFAEVQLQRDSFVVNGAPGRNRGPAVELPSAKDTMNSMLFGGLINSRMEQFEKDMQKGRKSRSVVDDE
jgi:prephenate dehydrogenase